MAWEGLRLAAVEPVHSAAAKRGCSEEGPPKVPGRLDQELERMYAEAFRGRAVKEGRAHCTAGPARAALAAADCSMDLR